MRIRRLTLRNFRRHRATDLELPDGITALVGPNGAGKSTILEAIAFALHGADAVRTAKQQLRHEDAPPGDAVSVTLEMDLGGQAITVTRELRGKNLTPQATVTVDGAVQVPPGAGSSEAASAFLTRILGLDRDALFSTIVARQGELSRLADQGAAQRKALVLRMVGIDRVDHAIARAREARRDAATRLEALRAQLAPAGVLEEAVAQARRDLEEANAAHQQANALLLSAQAAGSAAEARRAAADQLAAQHRLLAAARDVAAREQAVQAETLARAQTECLQAEAAEARRVELAPVSERLPVLQNQLTQALALRQAAAHRNQLVHSLTLLQQEVADLERKATLLQTDVVVPDLAGLRARIAAVDAEAAVRASRQAELERRADHFGKLGHAADCPTCERPLAGHVELLRERTAEAARQARADAAQSAAERSALAAELRAAEAAAAQAEAQRRERGILDARRTDSRRRLDDAVARLPPEVTVPDIAGLERDLQQTRRDHDELQRCIALAGRLPGLRAAAAHAAERLAAAQTAHAAAMSALTAAPDGKAELAAALADLAAARRAEREANGAAAAAAAALASAAERVRSAEARLAEEAARRASAAAAEADLRSWTALAGARSDGLLDRFRDHLVDRIGPALQEEASRLLALFSGGRYNELLLDSDYNVFVTDGGTPHTVDRLSGGEQDLVHLALRLAVSRLVAQRAGAPELRFLALDEVFGHLDRERRGLVVAALQGLSSLYAQVLVVSHLESLQDALDHAVSVSLRDGESVVHMDPGHSG